MDGISSSDRPNPFLVRAASEENKGYVKKTLGENKTVHPQEFKISSDKLRTLHSENNGSRRRSSSLLSSDKVITLHSGSRGKGRQIVDSKTLDNNEI